MTTEPNSGAELERLLAELARLSDEVERLEFERDGYYGEWQAAKNRLREFRRSPAWPIWLLWLLLVRLVLRPLGLLLAALPRLAGRLYLIAATPVSRLRARMRREVAEIAAPSPLPAGGIAVLGRRPRVLIVSPYSIHPPHHGGAVRLSNLVRELAEQCELYLLIFSQQGEDPEQRAALEPFCTRVDFHHWRPELRPDLFGLNPPSAQLFESDLAAAAIRDIVLGNGVDIVQLEYTELGQYAAAVPEGVPVILTEHDVAFRSFRRRRRLGFHARFAEGRAYGTSGGDWRRLYRHELAVCRQAHQIHAMSEDDGAYLARHMPDGSARIRVVPNGVDASFYEPPADGRDRRDVLYVGNFQNLPNVDALEYLAEDVWPLLRLARPEARLTVVGANPTDRVRRFDGSGGITVVGEVPDLRPYYHGHRLMVAPIRAGSGTRLKILEAFAAGLPVVSTTVGAEGIAYSHGRHLLIADGAVAISKAVEKLLEDDELCRSLADAGAELVRSTYDWRLVADSLVACYGELAAHPERSPVAEPLDAVRSDSGAGGDGPVELSVIIPTLDGGEPLTRCLEAIAGQRTGRSWELICVDSGSAPAELEIVRRAGARVVGIDRRCFNHGLTRDLGARLSRGEVLVFLNQDAIPCDEHWLERLSAPLLDGDDRLAAVQGGILELPDPAARFYWDSCGQRFYFTRESDRWIEAHHGIGFSTVNCAIRKDLWSRYPFGWARIMEDKKWQRNVVDEGHEILHLPEAAVFHTHDYDLRALLRRCRSEGYGWRSLGESYRLSDMLRDLLKPAVYREWLRGLLRRRIRSSAELLFPWARPVALYWGNHVGRDVAL